jgi:hypothetical protein
MRVAIRLAWQHLVVLECSCFDRQGRKLSCAERAKTGCHGDSALNKFFIPAFVLALAIREFVAIGFLGKVVLFFRKPAMRTWRQIRVRLNADHR